MLVDTGSFWLLQEGAGCYKKPLVATGRFWKVVVVTGRYWLLQEAAGCYRKLLVVPVQLFL